MSEWNTAEYFQSVKSRGSSKSQGKELKRLHNGKPTKFQLRRRRLHAATRGHWKRGRRSQRRTSRAGEDRMEDGFFQTLLKIQTLTDAMRKLLEGEISRRASRPNRGREDNTEMITDQNMADYSSTRRFTHARNDNVSHSAPFAIDE